MSSKAYQEAYSSMTDKQKDIMYDLFMKGVNYDGHVMNKFCDIEDAVAGIVKEQITPAQPTLYGYSIESLAAVAEIMRETGMSPEEALWTFKNNVQRIAEIVLKESRDALQKALEHMFAGGQDGTV